MGVIQGVTYYSMTDLEYQALSTFFDDNPAVAALYPGLLDDFNNTSSDHPGFYFAAPDALDANELAFLNYGLYDDYDVYIELGSTFFLLSNLPVHHM